jgi:tetratricopeptide (TPR) repeat protein
MVLAPGLLARRWHLKTRKVLRLALFAFLSSLALFGFANAQESHQHEHDSSERLGQVKFHISCDQEAQQKFHRALALLHSFQYVGSESAFAEIRTSAPKCAMAWWGEAMSMYHPLWVPPTPAELQKGREAITRAKSADAQTPREKDYIAALETFYKDAEKLDHWARARAYAVSMEGVYRRYPQDREAAIFYALALNGTAPASEKNLANRMKAAQILYRAWSHEPNHPGIAHYLIHSYDYPSLARLALPAARRYAKVAPSSAHALHMPSHIFTRLGMWPESILSNLDSAAAAKSKAQPGGATHDELHAMDYLMYAYLQGGQDEKAKSLLDSAMAFRQVDEAVFQVAFAWTAIPARFALERRQWKDAASLTLPPISFPWERFRFAEANLYFARAIGAARSGNLEGARKENAQLAAISAALGEVKSGYDWGTQVKIQLNAAAAWLAHVEGKTNEAEMLMRAAAEMEDSTDKHPVTPGSILPAREMLGDLLLELKQPQQALKEYEAILQTTPNRFNSLYGAARAAEQVRNRQKAKAYYAKLVTICNQATGRRSELQEARTFLARK